jgi:hypothetical protein
MSSDLIPSSRLLKGGGRGGGDWNPTVSRWENGRARWHWAKSKTAS